MNAYWLTWQIILKDYLNVLTLPLERRLGHVMAYWQIKPQRNSIDRHCRTFWNQQHHSVHYDSHTETDLLF